MRAQEYRRRFEGMQREGGGSNEVFAWAKGPLWKGVEEELAAFLGVPGGGGEGESSHDGGGPEALGAGECQLSAGAAARFAGRAVDMLRSALFPGAMGPFGESFLPLPTASPPLSPLPALQHACLPSLSPPFPSPSLPLRARR